MVCYFYLYLIKIGAVADMMKCLRRTCGKKPKVKPQFQPPPKKKKVKKVKPPKKKKVKS